MPRMRGRRAHVAGIRAIVLQQIKLCSMQKPVEVLEIRLAPAAAKARGVAEDGAARLAGFGIDAVVGVIDPPAGQERVTSDFDAFAVGVLGQFTKMSDVLRISRFEIHAASEREDEHLESDV